ncbi:MAG: HD domain-containing protein [Candidatus Omnitrophica bacterium]|nr:HD domain-containing protein [Candidatus Omnitrophota bacterium]
MSKGKKDLQKKLNTLLAVWKVNQAITSTLKTSRVLSQTMDAVTDVMKADAVTIRLLSRDKKRLVLKAGKGIVKEHRLGKRSIRADDGVAGETLSKNRPTISGNILKDKRYTYFPWLKREKLRSLLCVPLTFKDRRIGVLSIYNKKPSFYKKEDRETVTMFANQATIALENARLFEELHKNYLSTIKTLAAIIDLKDKYTRGHSEKVSYYSLLMAKELGLSQRRQELIQYAAFLHDIGKVGINLAILQKPGPLNAREWVVIHQHPLNGSAVIKQLGFLRELVPIILHHHERYDGKGYPAKKKNNEIPLGARILAVADAFDAMTSTRAYRPALSKKKAIEELERNKGTQFDPLVVDAFLSAIAKKRK